ncbi:MAG: transketolase family protein [Eubacteriales bacterium]
MGTKKETRVAYGETLVELGAMNEKVVVMDADLSGSTKTAMFKKAYPDRFFNAGIAEGNMVGVAAGLAASGYTVFVSSFAMFASGRAFEQIRNTAAYPNLNVKICASHAGITVGADGATHQCLEDIGIMRTIPHMTVINPADAVEARLAILAAAKHNGPVYMRFGRSAVPVVFDADTYKFDIGKGVQLVEGSDVTLVATGITVEMALEASEILKNRGISARVINMATIKPIDREILVKASRETGVIVTSEEHNIIGGLGSAVCEALCEEAPCIVERVGIRDSFGRSGSVNDLLKYYNLTAEEIVSRAEIALKRAGKR